MTDRRRAVVLIPLEYAVSLKDNLREELHLIEDQFPVQVNAAKAARHYVRQWQLYGAYPILGQDEADEYIRLLRTKGFSGNDSERRAFDQATEITKILEDLAKPFDVDVIAKASAIVNFE